MSSDENSVVPFRQRQRPQPDIRKRYSILVKEPSVEWFVRVSELCQVDDNPEQIAAAAQQSGRYLDVCIIDHRLRCTEWTAHQSKLVAQCSHAKWAKRIQRWLFHEVLPEIRRTGSYQGTPPAPMWPER
jgi:hypothetical protein